MSSVTYLVPAHDEATVAEFLGAFEPHDRKLLASPFADEVLALCDLLSSRLLRSAASRKFPDLVALGYWMRASELKRFRDDYFSSASAEVTLVPRGVTFHVAPANVDTVFVYSWLVSFLVGNRNIIRVSRTDSAERTVIFDLLMESLEQLNPGSALRRNTAVITYEHDDSVTAAISAVSDTRLVWGGDRTVRAFRRIPLGPYGKDLGFPDRTSFAAIDASAVEELADDELRALARRFFNDVYSLDQRACSSPRRIFWCGPTEKGEAVSRRFWSALAAVLMEASHSLDASTALAKEAFVFDALLDHEFVSVSRPHPALIVIRTHPGDVPVDHCGGGLLFESVVSSLEEISRLRLVSRHDQTMTYFGFSRAQIAQLAGTLNGSAVDRMVPIGQALTFDRRWDGFDLMRELSREVIVLGDDARMKG